MIGELLALVAMLMFASNILITKIASNRLSVSTGFVISVVVNLLFAALVLAIDLSVRSEPMQWDAAGMALFAVAGASSTYLGRYFFFEAIVRLGPAKASLFHVSSPAFTAVIAWLALGESLQPVRAIAIGATIAGLLLVSTPASAWRLRRPGAARTMSGWRRISIWLGSGFAIGAGATLAYSVGNVLRGASVRQWNEPIAGALLGAAAALALQLTVGSSHRALLRQLPGVDRAGLALYALGGVLTISAQMCMIASMRHIPVAITTMITLCTPIVVLPVSYWVMRNQESIGAATLAGAALTLGGMLAIVLA